MTRAMPIKTIYRELDFAYIQDGLTIFGQCGYLNQEYYPTTDRHWRICDLTGTRYVCIQLPTNEWALYNGNMAPIVLLQPTILKKHLVQPSVYCRPYLWKNK